MDLSALLSYINQHINSKVGVEKITGAMHNAVLKEVVNSLIEITGTGFGGNIAPNGNPGSQTNPIYFMADATGTYTYCGGVQVTVTPAFIVWNGTAWSVKEFGIPQGVGDPSQCQGLTTATDPQPQGKKVGDWYVFLGGGSLNWSGATKDAPGIVYLDRFEMVGGNNTAMWEMVAFGEGGGGSDPITVDAVPAKGSTNPVASGGVYKTIQETFLIESLSDYGFISCDEDFKITAVAAAAGLTITLKKSDDTAYTLGGTITGGDYLKVFGDVLNKTATLKGEII